MLRRHSRVQRHLTNIMTRDTQYIHKGNTDGHLIARHFSSLKRSLTRSLSLSLTLLMFISCRTGHVVVEDSSHTVQQETVTTTAHVASSSTDVLDSLVRQLTAHFDSLTLVIEPVASQPVKQTTESQEHESPAGIGEPKPSQTVLPYFFPPSSGYRLVMTAAHADIGAEDKSFQRTTMAADEGTDSVGTSMTIRNHSSVMVADGQPVRQRRILTSVPIFILVAAIVTLTAVYLCRHPAFLQNAWRRFWKAILKIFSYYFLNK